MYLQLATRIRFPQILGGDNWCYENTIVLIIFITKSLVPVNSASKVHTEAEDGRLFTR